MASKRNTDRHKPARMVRIPAIWAEALEEIAEEQQNNLTDQVKVAVREYLVRNERLPRPGGKPRS
jgi:hypothetical protein